MGLLAVIAALALLLLNTGQASADSKVYTDKHEVKFAVEPTIKGGTTLVQLRPLFESLGIELAWNNASQTVTGTKGSHTFSLTIGKQTATVNGKQVELAEPARLSKGHTLVPLRFVGEATGAVVGWHSGTRTISLYSSEYIEILGISRAEAQKLANTGATWLASGGSGPLSGFYVHSSADLTGYKGCRGMCWDYFYFINDHQLVKQMPQGGWDTVDCGKDTCFTYRIKDGQLIVDDYKTYSLEISDEMIELNGDRYFRHEPLYRMKLDGKYDASSYSGGSLGTGFASSSTMIFQPDGTFFDDSWIGVLSDGSDVSGDGSGVSFTITDESEAAGTYTVINYSILLEYKNGTREVYMFFRPDRNDQMLKIGGRDFLLDESYDPDAVPEPEKPLPPAEPYKDRLIIDNIASKVQIHQESPGISEEEAGITITLHGYQWAELAINPDYIDAFTNFGDGTIIAFTARYTVTNETGSDVDLSTLESMLWVRTGHLPSSPSLSPESVTVLKSGQSAELLSVYVLPLDLAEEWGYPDLVFHELMTTTGEEVFDGYEIDFPVDNPYQQ